MVNKVQELFHSFMIPSIYESMTEMTNESIIRKKGSKLNYSLKVIFLNPMRSL